MSKIITTESIGKGIADVVKDFSLSEKPTSRLVFHAQIHNKGIKGRIIRQRRESKTDEWIPDEAIDIRTLGKKETINIELDSNAVKNLYAAILELADILKRDGVKYGKHEYTVADSNAVIITDKNKVPIINKILAAGYGEEVWRNLAESNPSLATKLSYARIQEKKQEVVQDLKQRLQHGGCSETAGDDSWQNWIYKNNWLFGVNYKVPIEKSKINIAGIMPDFLFPTLDGFVDILEIKLPTDEVILEDKSHKGSWKWTAETNSAIGQVVNYLGEIDRLRLEVEKSVKTKYGYDLSFLKPRAYILIGNSASWASDKKEGLRKINHALHGITVLTYRDLLDRGNQSANLSPMGT